MLMLSGTRKGCPYKQLLTFKTPQCNVSTMLMLSGTRKGCPYKQLLTFNLKNRLSALKGFTVFSGETLFPLPENMY